MPTIAQLPGAAQAPSTADYIPVDQNVGGTYATGKITLGDLLSLLAASNMIPASMYLGTGAPTGGTGGVNGDGYVNTANGDLWQYATESGWSRVGSLLGPAGVAGAEGPAGPSYTITGQSTVASMAGTDLLGISQSGEDRTITLANALNGETINQGTPAQPVSTTDTFWTGQGGSTMVVQNFAAVWSWIVRQFPGYFLPVIELTSNSQLDSSVHNGKLIICSQPITITAGGTMGSGFQCTIINVSSGTCNLSGFTATSSGAGTLTPGQSAIIYTAAYSLWRPVVCDDCRRCCHGAIASRRPDRADYRRHDGIGRSAFVDGAGHRWVSVELHGAVSRDWRRRMVAGFRHQQHVLYRDRTGGEHRIRFPGAGRECRRGQRMDGNGQRHHGGRQRARHADRTDGGIADQQQHRAVLDRAGQRRRWRVLQRAVSVAERGIVDATLRHQRYILHRHRARRLDHV